MRHADFINLQYDNHTILVHVRQFSTFTSPHTGREMKEIEGVTENLDEKSHKSVTQCFEATVY